MSLPKGSKEHLTAHGSEESPVDPQSSGVRRIIEKSEVSARVHSCV